MANLNKSFSKIKSKHFGNEIKNWASSYNIRKQSNRKRRNGNSTGVNRNQSKNANKSYYTQRDKEHSKRKINPCHIATEITEENLRKIGILPDSERHWENTDISDK